MLFAATSSNHSPTHNVLKQTGWNSFDENIAQNQSAETLLKALKNVQQSMYGTVADMLWKLFLVTYTFSPSPCQAQ